MCVTLSVYQTNANTTLLQMEMGSKPCKDIVKRVRETVNGIKFIFKQD